MNPDIVSAPEPAPVAAGTTPAQSAMIAPPGGGRLASMDAYRGFVMFLMMAEVLHLSRVARAVPESGFWQFLGEQQSHVEWLGCTLHDLIQPSFSFLVGVALPFSIASRMARGQSRSAMTWHALWRAVLLILLGVFLRSTGENTTSTNWTFEDTLTQIGLGYAFLFVLGFRSTRDHFIALGLILVGYWAAFALYPLPGAAFEYAQVGVSKAWLETNGLSGFAAHWQKNSNAAWAFDTWFMNLFPRERPFLFNRGGYATLSFIPTLATMILGLIAGNVLRNPRDPLARIRWLAVAGVICLASGWLLGVLGICPVVKRIWTPSWVLFSGGWCFLLLAAFYWVIDVLKIKRWSFPLVVIGVNSIAAYVIAHLFDSFIAKNLTTHLGKGVFNVFGAPYQPLLHGAATLLVMWLMLFWMYRRKLFLKI
jgi:heparan-alpha-glucosaminide N-acetyltransferase